MSYKTILLLIFLYSFNHITVANVDFYSINSLYNVSMRQTASVCKDDDGFIWTASKTGVMRISDRNVKLYHLPYNSANVLFVKLTFCHNKLLAFSNNGQLFEYNKVYDKFNLVTDLRELLANQFIVVNKIIGVENNEFLIASTSGLHRMSGEKISQNIIDNQTVNNVVKYENDKFIYSLEEKVFIMNKYADEHEEILDFENVNVRIPCLYYDDENNSLWLGTMSEGLFIYNFNDSTINDFKEFNIPKQPVLAITKNINNTFLVGIDGQGIWEISSDGKTVINKYKHDENNPYSINSDGVYDIFSDENKVWIATYGDGVSFYEQSLSLVNNITHQINTKNSLVNNNVNSVIEDKYGNLWFATDNGVSCWDRASNKWTNFYNNIEKQALVFLALAEDDEGNVWAGSYSSGVYVIDIKTKREIAHYSYEKDKENFTCKFILDIFKDSEGDLWIGGSTSGDMLCYLAKEKRFKKYDYQPVISFYELEPGKMLLACTHGMVLLDKETGDNEIFLLGHIVQDIHVDERELWVATSGDGLVRYDLIGSDIKYLMKKDGLLSDFVNSIIKINNNLWVGTEAGLSQLYDGRDSITIYNSQLSQFNQSFNINSKFVLKDKSLIFGTNSGAILFNPRTLEKETTKGEIFIQDINISGLSIRDRKEILNEIEVNKQSKIILNHNLNTISFDLLPINGNNIDRAKFSWWLEGVESDWSLPVELTSINYANIPIGNFKLHIKMYDGALSSVVDQRIIEIEVEPPFWKTVWFNTIGVLIFTGLLFLLIRIYINQIKQRHAKEKIDFFTNISHDLRTSLTLISAPIEELSRIPELPNKAEYFIKLAIEQSKRLVYVTTQLLDFQKVDVGKGELFLSMVDVVSLVTLRKSMFEAAAEKKKLKINLKSNVDEYFTAIDEMKIEKTIDNLLSNAVKYSYQGGVIDVELLCESDSWSVKIIDYGLGISDKVQKKLFKEFYRGENAVNSKLVGSGIGLLIVRNYVEMHGGKVVMKSEEGKGTTFNLKIPYKDVETVNRQSKQVNYLDIKREIEFDDIIFDDITPKEDFRVLIVEDNKDLQNFLKHSLQKYYNVETAENGEVAWKMIKENEPDLIISDIMMPKIDGLELCRLVKYTSETAHIPVILLTALSDEAQELEGLGVGAEDYVTKPFNIPILLLRIRKILKGRDSVIEESMYLFENNVEASKQILKNELNDEFLRKAITTVKRNISDKNFTREDFANQMEISTSLLYKKLKALTNQPPTDFVRLIRLNFSVELLKTKNFSVSEISERCGFSSPSYYSRLFKTQFGITPREYLE